MARRADKNAAHTGLPTELGMPRLWRQVCIVVLYFRCVCLEIPSPHLPDGLACQASWRAVKSRIKSVQNIKKITSAMKMVAASKMKKAQTQQEQAVGVPKPFLKLFGEETSEFQPLLNKIPANYLMPANYLTGNLNITDHNYYDLQLSLSAKQ